MNKNIWKEHNKWTSRRIFFSHVVYHKCILFFFLLFRQGLKWFSSRNKKDAIKCNISQSEVTMRNFFRFCACTVAKWKHLEFVRLFYCGFLLLYSAFLRYKHITHWMITKLCLCTTTFVYNPPWIRRLCNRMSKIVTFLLRNLCFELNILRGSDFKNYPSNSSVSNEWLFTMIPTSRLRNLREFFFFS